MPYSILHVFLLFFYSPVVLAVCEFPILRFIIFLIRVKRRRRKSILRPCSAAKLLSHSTKELEPEKKYEHAVSKGDFPSFYVSIYQLTNCYFFHTLNALKRKASLDPAAFLSCHQVSRLWRKSISFRLHRGTSEFLCALYKHRLLFDSSINLSYFS